jgi:hypothetical protein
MSDTADAFVLDLHRKVAPALRFPPPGQSTCASIAALLPTATAKPPLSRLPCHSKTKTGIFLVVSDCSSM